MLPLHILFPAQNANDENKSAPDNGHATTARSEVYHIFANSAREKGLRAASRLQKLLNHRRRGKKSIRVRRWAWVTMSSLRPMG